MRLETLGAANSDGERAIYRVRGFWLMGVLAPLLVVAAAYDTLVASSYVDLVVVVYARLGLAYLAYWIAQTALRAWEARDGEDEATGTDATRQIDRREIERHASEQRRLFRFSFLLASIILLLALPGILSAPELRVLPWEAHSERTAPIEKSGQG